MLVQYGRSIAVGACLLPLLLLLLLLLLLRIFRSLLLQLRMPQLWERRKAGGMKREWAFAARVTPHIQSRQVADDVSRRAHSMSFRKWEIC